MAITVTFPRTVLERFRSMRLFTDMPVNQLLGEYASGCLRDFCKPDWDDAILDNLTDEQLEEIIHTVLFEKELRAEAAADEEDDEPDYLEIDGDGADAGMPERTRQRPPS